MKEKYSIKDGRTEAVMWILYKDNQILIEDRPQEEQGESRCIPCGHIDLNRDKDNYIESAFLRESQEEFESGSFKPVKYEFLTSVDFDEPNKQGGIDKLRLHYFVVTEWTGDIPEYTVEDDKKHADLVWFPISKYKELPQSCDRQALEELLKRI
jgi:8-oxo-dGTP pyrophosphatase MutT (NUDIX family)|tara:strand:+ start:1660 stop:2121 length:462 start_codon:yes stop_codon:yes gene_type:complete